MMQGKNADDTSISLLWAMPEQADKIAALHGQLFAKAWSKASLLRQLDHPGSTALAACDQNPDNVIGFVLGRIAADECEILTLGVAPRRQRQGIGRKLVEGLLRALVRAETSRVFLEVAADNDAALALYKSLGFAEAGRRKNYYQGEGGSGEDRDALQLALNLNQPHLPVSDDM